MALVGYGCAVNKSAGDSPATNYEFLSLITRCSVHAASGKVKRK